MRDAQIMDVVDEAEDALLKAESGAQLFQRGQELVRVTRIDEVVDENGVRRRAGAMVITPVTLAWFTERLDTVADWRAFRQSSPQGPGWMPANPKGIFVSTLLERRNWRFPVLHGITTCPTLAADGRIVQSPGFDEGTGMYLDFEPGAFPEVPENPTLDDARAALKTFANPLRSMPWSHRNARSVAISAGLTALVRASLRTAPLIAFDAPTAGTGKSLCCDWAGIIKTGATPPAMSQGKTAEEDEKRLSSVLYAGDTILLLDNCEIPIEGDFLCSMLTQQVVQARILGETRKVALPSNALVLASGNNLATRGDMTRRAVICRLDAQTDRPEERRFDFDVKAETLAQRASLVVAGLTVLRAYIVAGRPLAGTLKTFGSFEDWDWIREALVWCGETDPCATRDELMAQDSSKSELTDIMDAWERAVGGRMVTVEQVGHLNNEAATVLHTRFNEITGEREWNNRKVAWWLRKHKDRRVGDRAFMYVPDGMSWKWQLNGVEDSTPSPSKPLDF
jgi:hypothetical protein